jgi:hypothetical protein
MTSIIDLQRQVDNGRVPDELKELLTAIQNKI